MSPIFAKLNALSKGFNVFSSGARRSPNSFRREPYIYFKPTPYLAKPVYIPFAGAQSSIAGTGRDATRAQI